MLSGVGEEAAVIPAIVYAELLAGVRLADTPARAASCRAKIDALTQRVPLLPFGTAGAECWAEVYATLHRAGTPIPVNDLVVASTAFEPGFGVVVGPDNEAHFRGCPAFVSNGSAEPGAGVSRSEFVRQQLSLVLEQDRRHPRPRSGGVIRELPERGDEGELFGATKC